MSYKEIQGASELQDHSGKFTPDGGSAYPQCPPSLKLLGEGGLSLQGQRQKGACAAVLNGECMDSFQQVDKLLGG